jgi:hypothetical protein
METSAQDLPGPPLPTEDHVRILKLQPGSDNAPINCQLLTTTLALAPDSEAVSYTWGSSMDRQAVHVDVPGTRIQYENTVTSNCVSALRRLRYHDNRDSSGLML